MLKMNVNATQFGQIMPSSDIVLEAGLVLLSMADDHNDIHTTLKPDDAEKLGEALMLKARHARIIAEQHAEEIAAMNGTNTPTEKN